MSWRTKTLYQIHCDNPGCDEIPPESCEGETWYEDKSYADDVAKECDWQVITFSSGKVELHYCYRHIHATCETCGKVTVAAYDDLIADGWAFPASEFAECGECRRKPHEKKLGE